MDFISPFCCASSYHAHVFIRSTAFSLFPIKMPDSLQEGQKQDVNPEQLPPSEDSEYVRLVIPNEPTTAEADNLRPQTDDRFHNFVWWTKALSLFAIVTIIGLVFLNWGVPFLLEKVHPL